MRGRPSRPHWTEADLIAFRQRLQDWMDEQGIGPQELEQQLGYSSGGCLVRMYLGELETSRAPSATFVARLKEAGFSPNGGHRPTTPDQLHRIRAGVVAVADLPPGTVVLGEPRQCPECLAEVEEGTRHPARTWYVFPHPNQRYCCLRHRRA